MLSTAAVVGAITPILFAAQAHADPKIIASVSAFLTIVFVFVVVGAVLKRGRK